MPNWCTNEVTVFGKEEELTKFSDYVKSKESYHGDCSTAYEMYKNEDGKWDRKEKDHCDGKEFKDGCIKVTEPFSFQSIMPMPPELVNTTSPVHIYETQEELDDYLDTLSVEAYNGSEEYYKSAVNRGMTREYSDYLMKTYGANNWYDWCNDQWGTKWDVSQVGIELNPEWEQLQYEFDTAWGPPEGIHIFLADMFPDLSISWFFREEGQQIAGYL